MFAGKGFGGQKRHPKTLISSEMFAGKWVRKPVAASKKPHFLRNVRRKRGPEVRNGIQKHSFPEKSSPERQCRTS
jgi:hypothetical protein